jgi:hypothetical protein
MRFVAAIGVLALILGGATLRKTVLPARNPLNLTVNSAGSCLSVAEILELLTRETKVPLSADAANRNRIVFLCAKGRPLREVMNRLAESLDLTWFKRGGGYVLRESPQQRAYRNRLSQSAAKAKEDRNLAAIMTEMARRRRERDLPASERFHVPDQEYGPEQSDDCWEQAYPDSNIAFDVLDQWSEAQWWTVLEGSTAQVIVGLSGIEEPCKTWQVSAAKEYDLEGFVPTHARSILRSKEGRKLANCKSLRISVKAFDYSVDVVSSLIDLHNRPLLQSHSLMLPLPSAEKPSPASLVQIQDNPVISVPKPISDLTAERLLYLWKPYGQWVHSHGANDFLDPLDVVTSPLLRQISSSTNMPIVVELNDGMLRSQAPTGHCRLADLLYQIGQDEICWKSSGDWIVGAASQSVRIAGNDSCPRPILHQLYRVLFNGVPSFDDLASIASHMTDSRFRQLLDTLQVTWRGFQGPVCQSEEIAMMRFWATLSPNQKSVLRSDKSIPARALSPMQRDALTAYKALCPDDGRAGPWLNPAKSPLIKNDDPLTFYEETAPGIVGCFFGGGSYHEDGTIDLPFYDYSLLVSHDEYKQFQNGPGPRQILKGYGWRSGVMVGDTGSGDITLIHAMSEPHMDLPNFHPDENLRRD